MKKNILCLALGLASSVVCAQAQDSSQSLGSGMQSASQPSASSSSGASGGQSGARSAVQDYRVTAGPGVTEEPALVRLAPQTENGITYMCGGVGQLEQAFMKQEANKYDMMLTFATSKGAYLADVNVDIRDGSGGSVLQTSCDGPIMLVNLPKAGKYQVRADAGGYLQNKNVNVRSTGQGGRIASAVLTWPQRVAEGPSATQSGSGASGSGASSSDGKMRW